MRRFVPDSPGFVRPSWMDDEQYAEFRMTPEYAMEVSRPEEPDDFYVPPGEDDYADFMAQQDEDHIEEACDEAKEMPLDELKEAHHRIGEIIAERERAGEI